MKFKTKWLGMLYLGTGTKSGRPVLPPFAILASGAMDQSSIAIPYVWIDSFGFWRTSHAWQWNMNDEAGTDAGNQFLGLWYFAHAFDRGSCEFWTLGAVETYYYEV